MRIAMIGQKGVPATHGGVERHVEELGARLADRGHDVLVFTRPNYTDPAIREHRGMRLVSLPTIGTKHLDAIVHSAVSSVASWGNGIDVVHYHAIGPSLTSPVARVRGRRIVATIHGQDWRRGKWGGAATQILRVAERMALTVPHATVSVSESLAKSYGEHGYTVHYIPNGVSVPSGDDEDFLDALGLRDGKYVLFAGRLVPEKGLHHLLAAYRLDHPGLPLVVAGDASYSDDYVDQVQTDGEGIATFVGYQYGNRLAALFRHCALFVLPSDLEGLPIVLLEALAYGSPVLASDIAPNVEVLGERGSYFSAGNPASLGSAMRRQLEDVPAFRAEAARAREVALAEYDWESVADKTEQLYKSLFKRAPSTS